MTLEQVQERTRSQGNYAQLFVYRLPKKNHDSLVRLQQKLTAIHRKHGTLYMEFYQLHSNEAFQGLTSIGKTVSARDDEEVWIELDHYKDRNHRDSVVDSANQDAEAEPLYGELMGLVSQGYTMIMGEFKPLKI